MTCKERLAMEHPDVSRQELEHMINATCPVDYNYAPEPDYCDSPNTCDKCWDREISESTVIKDSGDRTQFDTGAVRDMREGKGRCDLMPLEVVAEFLILFHSQQVAAPINHIAWFQKSGDTEELYRSMHKFCMMQPDWNLSPATMFLEVAKHFEEGAKKYGENNWQKGIPVNCYIDSAARHYLKWLRGDKDEPHDRAFVWNLMCCIWEVDYHKEEKNV